MPLLIPFILGAVAVHAWHTSVNHAAHEQRLRYLESKVGAHSPVK